MNVNKMCFLLIVCMISIISGRKHHLTIKVKIMFACITKRQYGLWEECQLTGVDPHCGTWPLGAGVLSGQNARDVMFDVHPLLLDV